MIACLITMITQIRAPASVNVGNLEMNEIFAREGWDGMEVLRGCVGIKSNVADSRSECNSKLGSRLHSRYRSSRFENERDNVKSKTAALRLNECPPTPKFG